MVQLHQTLALRGPMLWHWKKEAVRPVLYDSYKGDDYISRDKYLSFEPQTSRNTLVMILAPPAAQPALSAEGKRLAAAARNGDRGSRKRKKPLATNVPSTYGSKQERF